MRTGVRFPRGSAVAAVTRKIPKLSKDVLFDAKDFSCIPEAITVTRSRQPTVKQKHAIDKSGSRPSW